MLPWGALPPAMLFSQYTHYFFATWHWPTTRKGQLFASSYHDRGTWASRLLDALAQGYGGRSEENHKWAVHGPSHSAAVGPRPAAEGGDLHLPEWLVVLSGFHGAGSQDYPRDPCENQLEGRFVQAPHARGNLSILLNAICMACKFVDSAVRKVRGRRATPLMYGPAGSCLLGWLALKTQLC